MSKKRFVTMVGGTVACALGIGFFMQRAETAAPRDLLAPLPSPIQQMVLKPSGASVGEGETVSMAVRNVSLTSILPVSAVPNLPRPEPQDSSLKVSYDVPVSAPVSAPVTPNDPDTPRLGCAITAKATPAPLASVDLAVSAPCFGNERVTVHHSGMMFTDVTDKNGDLVLNVPVLSEQAVFIIAFADGQGSVALAKVPDLHNFNRVALQWDGNSGFQIHAREFGAAFGEDGHVWSGTASDAMNSGGSVARLGNPDTLAPQMAEVYTFPKSSAKQSGTVALSIEAEVTAENCGRDISAQTLELRGNQMLRTRDLVLSVPNCDAKGDFLVLNNLVEDLTIAAR